jgi:Spy/CpxP family protein refolding chaperone
MKRLGIVALFISIVTLLSDCGRRDYIITPERVEGISQRIQNRLEMVDAQREVMAELTKKIIDKLPVWKEQRRRTRDMIIEQFEGESFDRAAAESVFRQNENDMREMNAFYISILAEFHSILTPEQRRAVAEYGRRWYDGQKRDKESDE